MNMRKNVWLRSRVLLAGMFGVLVLNMGSSCTGLSDQQLASIWQSVLTTALTTITQNVLGGVAS
jgi:hypothetical protein